MIGDIKEIEYKTAVDFLLPKHYSGRTPSITKAFGWYVDNELKAVCTFGKPASPPLCKGVCGEKYYKSVYELNRLCRVESFELPLSMFVSKCLRVLKKENWIIVSYSDTAMHHSGYIYQACNFIYTGKTKERTDKYTENGKHARHYDNDKQGEYRVVRSAKHRYIYFCTSNKALKKEWKGNLRYPILPYPKEQNQNYILGTYQKPVLITVQN